MKLLIAIPLLLMCSNVNATTCMEDCYWVDEEPTRTREWMDTSSTESGETKEKIKFEKSRRSGPNDSYICYRLQNGLESYGDYTVAKESPTSENVSLYKDGVLQRECNFTYYPFHITNHKKKHKKDHWHVTKESGYWRYTNTKNGYWKCTPVPEPATMILFGTGLVSLIFLKKKRK